MKSGMQWRQFEQDFNALQNARRYDWFAIGHIKDFFHSSVVN